MIWDEPLKECTQAVLTTLEKDMRKKKSSQADLDATVSSIIKNLRKQKNGSKFKKLFDDGDISDYGGDDSAADCALCSLIAFRTGDDPELIDAILENRLCSVISGNETITEKEPSMQVLRLATEYSIFP